MHPGKRYGLRGPLAAFMDRIPSFLHPCNAREDEGHRVKRSMTVSNRGIFHDTPGRGQAMTLPLTMEVKASVFEAWSRGSR